MQITKPTVLPRSARLFIDVAREALELGCIPQTDGKTIVLHPRLLPGNWRIGVVVKPERAAA